MVRPDGRTTRLDDEEIAGFLSLLGGAGAETVTKLVANAVVLFHRHPDQYGRVVADPGADPRCGGGGAAHPAPLAVPGPLLGPGLGRAAG